MSADAGPIQAGYGSAAGRVRLLTLNDLDRRTRAYQRVKETRAEVLADLGGESQLSMLERIATDNVAVLNAMLVDVSARWLNGEAVEVTDVATLQNTFNRTASLLGWQRRTKDVTPTLDSFIDTIPAADDADPDEASQEA